MPWWFPGAGFKKEAQKWRPVVQDFVDVPFAATLAAVVCHLIQSGSLADEMQNQEQGNAPLSVAAAQIAKGVEGLMVDQKQLPANLYLGGADTVRC